LPVNRARFQKRVRLLTPAQFDRAFKQGRRLHQGPMSAVVASNTLDHARLGFALGKKHAKRAVQRNRLKRLLRERFRLHQQGLQAVDLVVFLRAALPDLPGAEVDAVDRLWNKLSSTCAKS
jgi:ribonuclease P protein component